MTKLENVERYTNGRIKQTSKSVYISSRLHKELMEYTKKNNQVFSKICDVAIAEFLKNKGIDVDLTKK